MTLFSRLRLLFWVIQPRTQVLKFNNFCFHFRIPNGRGEGYIKGGGWEVSKKWIATSFPSLWCKRKQEMCKKCLQESALSLLLSLQFTYKMPSSTSLLYIKVMFIKVVRWAIISMRQNLIFGLVFAGLAV